MSFLRMLHSSVGFIPLHHSFSFLPVSLELGANDTKLGIIGRHWLIRLPLRSWCVIFRTLLSLSVSLVCFWVNCGFQSLPLCFLNTCVTNHLHFGFSSSVRLCEFNLTICSDGENNLVKKIGCDFCHFLTVDFLLLEEKGTVGLMEFLVGSKNGIEIIMIIMMMTIIWIAIIFKKKYSCWFMNSWVLSCNSVEGGKKLENSCSDYAQMISCYH